MEGDHPEAAHVADGNRQVRVDAPEPFVGNMRTMGDIMMPTAVGFESSIRMPAVRDNNWQINPAIISMVSSTIQFHGLAHEDPNLHIATFLELLSTFNIFGLSDDAVRLRLFPFSLRDRAKAWLLSLPAGSIANWKDLMQKFLNKYFPPSKTAKLRGEISNFAMMDTETLYEAWERFKDLLRKCPHHDVSIEWQMRWFYEGVTPAARSAIEAAAGGSIMKKTPSEVYELMEEISSNAFNWPSERTMHQRRAAGVHSVDHTTQMEMKLEALTKRIESMTTNQGGTTLRCDNCGGGHPTHECRLDVQFGSSQNHEPVNYVSNYRGGNGQGNFYGGNYNQPWRNHPNFSWSNPNNAQRPPQGPFEQEKKPTLEETLQSYINSSDKRLQSMEASIKNLENQVGQIASRVTSREHGSLPSNTETNPKEQLQGVEIKHLEAHEALKGVEPILEGRIEAYTSISSMPPKLKDPGRLTIPCDVGPLRHERALCDLGASINVLPLSLFRKFGLGKLNEAKFSVQLADQSLKKPQGVIEDVLVKVGDFVFPADFVVLDMETNANAQVILGRPFLATAGAIIDARDGKLTLRSGDEQIMFANDGTKTKPPPLHTDSHSLVGRANNSILEIKEVWHESEQRVIAPPPPSPPSNTTCKLMDIGGRSLLDFFSSSLARVDKEQAFEVRRRSKMREEQWSEDTGTTHVSPNSTRIPLRGVSLSHPSTIFDAD